MAMKVRLEVWGPWALFSRPEMKVERVSYDVMTPSAARGVLEAIYWKPQMRWVVDEIRVLRPIRFTNIRRNEVTGKVSVKGPNGAERAMRLGRGSLGIEVDDSGNRAQRASMVLRDVRYGIEAHVEVLDSTDEGGRQLEDAEAKHLEMFKRRAGRGQYFHHPYLGTREFPADFVLVDQFAPTCVDLLGERDLGYVLHDIEFQPDAKGRVVESWRGTRCSAVPRFFRAVMRDGVIAVPAVPAGGTTR